MAFVEVAFTVTRFVIVDVALFARIPPERVESPPVVSAPPIAADEDAERDPVTFRFCVKVEEAELTRPVRLARPETASVPEAKTPPVVESVVPEMVVPEIAPRLVSVAAVIVPVATIFAAVRSPEKKAPPWTARDLEKAGLEVPRSHDPDVAVIPPTFVRSYPSAFTS